MAGAIHFTLPALMYFIAQIDQSYIYDYHFLS